MRPWVWVFGGAGSATRQFGGGRWSDQRAEGEGVSGFVGTNKFGDSGGSRVIHGLRTCRYAISDVPYNITGKLREITYLRTQAACQQGKSARANIGQSQSLKQALNLVVELMEPGVGP